MPTAYTVVLGDDRSCEVTRLARENEVTEEEVLRQLIDIGIRELGEEAPV